MRDKGPPAQEGNSSAGREACPRTLGRYDKHPTPSDHKLDGPPILDAATGQRFCRLSPGQISTAGINEHTHTHKQTLEQIQAFAFCLLHGAY